MNKLSGTLPDSLWSSSNLVALHIGSWDALLDDPEKTNTISGPISPLINGLEGEIWCKCWYTFTDMEKKDHLDRELEGYFNGLDEVDLALNE